jgi:hypothetical protein
MRKFFCFLATTTLLLLNSVSLTAAEGDKATFTDPAAAGFDYQVQGEYSGTMTGSTDKIGAQVIALGHDEFEVVGYVGGLPGDGWSRGDTTHQAKGKRDGDKVVVKPADDSGAKGVIEGETLTVYNEEGDKVAVLKKVERKSPTLGKKAPDGAVVLFDGKNTDAFNDAKLVDGDLLGATNCYSKQKFGDHQLHVEFRTPFMPEARGQGRGNSGVYIQSRYELQVLDSFGLEGADNEAGGIYSIARPKLNMCYPPLAWQTYDIDFQAARYDESGKKTENARVTIRHNGVVIHDDLELSHGTPGRFDEGAGPEALFLQNHGNPVAFRNIWVVEK